MNIFATNDNPIISAWSLDDKRVIKMILESAQLLSTAIYKYKGQITGLYSPTHANHPCTIWASENRENFDWLVEHAFSLCNVYQLVYQKEHKSKQIIALASSLNGYMPLGNRTEFPNCTPFKHSSDNRPVIWKYQEYLNNKWTTDEKTPTWKYRVPPAWRNLSLRINFRKLH